MADSMPNGAPPTSGDVEMKEEVVAEVYIIALQRLHTQNSLIVEQAPLSSIQPASDPTDPQPPPQTQTPIMPAPEHLSAIQSGPPAAATPPVSSAPATRPGSMPPQPSSKPDKPVAHGGPTRQYLNQNVTPHLLEAMKYLAVYEPDKPLLWLSEFLRDRSKEVEG